MMGQEIFITIFGILATSYILIMCIAYPRWRDKEDKMLHDAYWDAIFNKKIYPCKKHKHQGLFIDCNKCKFK